MGNGCSSNKAVNVAVTASKSKPKSLKLVVVGDSLSGKSSILARYKNNSFTEAYNPTQSIDIVSVIKKVNVPHQEIVTMELWEIPASNEILLKNCLQNADAAIVVLDLSDEDSYSEATKWRKAIAVNFQKSTSLVSSNELANSLESLQNQLPVLLLGNKFDVVKQSYLQQCYVGNSTSKINIASDENQQLVEQTKINCDDIGKKTMFHKDVKVDNFENKKGCDYNLIQETQLHKDSVSQHLTINDITIDDEKATETLEKTSIVEEVSQEMEANDDNKSHSSTNENTSIAVDDSKKAIHLQKLVSHQIQEDKQKSEVVIIDNPIESIDDIDISNAKDQIESVFNNIDHNGSLTSMISDASKIQPANSVYNTNEKSVEELKSDKVQNSRIDLDKVKMSSLQKGERDKEDNPKTSIKLKKIFYKNIKMQMEVDSAAKIIQNMNPTLIEFPQLSYLKTLERFAKENDFIAGIPVSAKDPKGGVHEAIQSLVRRLIMEVNESTKRKRKHAEIAKSQSRLTKRIKEGEKFENTFQPLTQVGIVEVDEVLKLCNVVLEESESLISSFFVGLNEFKQACFDEDLVERKQINFEECIAALKLAVETPQKGSQGGSEIRLSLLLQKQPNYSLVAEDEGGFVSLRIVDENHEYVNIHSDTNLLHAQVLSLLDLYQDKVFTRCANIVLKFEQVQGQLAHHLTLISDKEKKAWDTAVAAGRSQNDVRRILIELAHSKARTRGTLEQFREIRQRVSDMQLKTKGVILF